MSVEMKLGRWMARDGSVHAVDRFDPEMMWPWRGARSPECWDYAGRFQGFGILRKPFDLIRYLGPLELSPTPACADQDGTPVVSTVSTETAGEQLQRMRQRYNAMEREASIYSGLLAALDQAKSDLDEAIKRLEGEVEG